MGAALSTATANARAAGADVAASASTGEVGPEPGGALVGGVELPPLLLPPDVELPEPPDAVEEPEPLVAPFPVEEDDGVPLLLVLPVDEPDVELLPLPVP